MLCDCTLRIILRTMFHKCICATIFGCVACVIALGEAASLPFVSPMFSDNMVMQRGKLNTIWGWSTPGQEIRVQVGGATAKTVTGSDGYWQVRVQPPAGGGPYTIFIDGPQHKELHETLVGDVWLCGGQSNMELPLSRTRDGDQVIKSAHNPEIRLFKVAGHPSYSASAIPDGQWKICSPETISSDGGFSAVAYFYARRLQEHIHVPIGLVEDCLGGTPAEAWTSAEALHQLKDFDGQLAELERLKAGGGPQYGNYIMHWYDEYDIGLKSNTWAAVDLDDSNWKAVDLPGGFRELGVAEAPSVCWFRKEITLPDPLPNGPASIQLGVVERMDTTYINGHWVGASAWVENPRVYTLKKGVLVPGKNLLAIRVFKVKPNGGFMSKPEVLRLVVGDTVIPLAGTWKGALSVDASPPHPMPMGFENWPVMPSVLYQGMLKPVAPLAISGAIWYQGEANAERANQYRRLLPLMIEDWRKLFGQGEFPFYIVSLPAFMHHQASPVEASWAELREAQAITARTVANCALAVTIDTGDPDNIHPADKQIVGDRLAYCALATHYREKIPYQGPTFKSLEHLPGALRLRFEHTDGGLVARNGKPEEFSVAGNDHVWHWADARLEGDSIVVSSPQVPNPEAARYAWQAYPTATLYNGANLPAVPFRTDNWGENNKK
jgi:sialate O-acetylesterase